MLGVVSYHAGILDGGFVGVDVFFVISGFLVTGLLWAELERDGRIDLGSFYARRARRLLPAAVLVLVVTVGLSVVVLSPLAARSAVDDAVAAALYVGNLRFAAVGSDYLAGTAAESPVLHYWSLGVEEQLYVLWPLVVVAAALRWRPSHHPPARAVAAWLLGAGGAASLALSVHLTETSPPWAFYSLPPRAWEFVVGAIVALGAGGIARVVPTAAAPALSLAGLSAIAWSAATYGASTPFPGLAATVPVLGTAAVLAAGGVSSGHGVSGLLGRRVPRLLGRLSYTWYLWHWPLLVLGDRAWGPLGWVETGAILLWALGLAWLTSRVVEQPLRRAGRLTARPAQTLLGGVGLTAVALAVAVVAAATLPDLTGGRAVTTPALAVEKGAQAPAGTSPPATRATSTTTTLSPVQLASAAVAPAVAGGTAQDEVPSNLDPPLARAAGDKARPFLDGCHQSWTGTATSGCSYGAPSGATTIVLFGDSHATHWFPPLEQLATARGWRLLSLTKTTCPPVALSIFSPVLARPFRECDEWRREAVARMRAEGPVLVVFGLARHYGPEYRFDVLGPVWPQTLAEQVRLVREAGPEVLVLGPVPKPSTSMPQCLSEHLTDAVTCVQSEEGTVQRPLVDAERRAVESAGGAYVDVTPWFCEDRLCAGMVGNLLVYRDDNHLTTTYARWLAPAVTAAVDAALAAG
ncbi:MAG: O-antigen acetylase [uncultured Acidimicrobiales bacterium]|uniref:O-antigen acetylase n=1 Tax=uncultured Acidimicrobiales bacterium TaxID=310071 RepID=A0A6J4I9S7_9ACTN|nr:MAG: O-antigen acetylase [uncultured Acidimicrobiales bacterium]